MPQTGFIDGNAPPFIMLAIAFATWPLLYNFIRDTSLVSPSRYRQSRQGIIIASMIPYFFLGIELLVRIYLNGQCNISAPTSEKILCSLDFIILLTTGICFALAFLLMWWYFFYLTWYRRYHRQATVVFPGEKDQSFGEETLGEDVEAGENNKSGKPSKDSS